MTENFAYYGRAKINYKIKRSDRRTLGITVNPTGEILISVSHDVSEDEVKDMVIKKGSWIIDQLKFFSNRPIPEKKRQALSGESFYYLGKQYRLKVLKSDYENIKINNDRILLETPFPEDKKNKLLLLKKWYYQEAKKIFTDQFHKSLDLFDNPRVNMRIKKLDKSWGKYHPISKQVILNIELIVAPLDCIDYVIIHELCHTVILNHDRKFKNLISTKIPHWKKLKCILEEFSNGLDSLFTSLKEIKNID